MKKDKVVIIGAGHAGGSVAASLRQFGYQGHITLIGDEGSLPYQRPPLSKSWLKGEANEASLLLKPESFYQDKQITLKLNAKVSGIDRNHSLISIEGEAPLQYDHLVIATGASPRYLSLPGSELPDVVYLRNVQDAEQLKLSLEKASRIAIIGGGYIGLEVAASARSLGISVTLIEQQERLLARVASSYLSDFYYQSHQDNGVDFILNASVSTLTEQSGKLSGVILDDGRKINCDLVLVGIGAIPNTHLAEEAGLLCDNGIVVNQAAQTSDPNIFAIGDVSNRPLGADRVRLESVPNAIEQAKQVARTIVGKSLASEETPWFWSDQYAHKLQIAGLSQQADARILRGKPEGGRFSVFHLKGNRLLSVEAVNNPGDFMIGKRWISSGIVVNPDSLSDVDIPLKDCVAG